MAPFDQILRAGFGLGLIYAGLTYAALSSAQANGNPALAAILTGLGVLSTVTALFAVCPIYHLAGIDTRLADCKIRNTFAQKWRALFPAAAAGLAIGVMLVFGVALRIPIDISGLPSARLVVATATDPVFGQPPASLLALVAVATICFAMWAGLLMASVLATRMAQHEARLMCRSQFDAVTGLPNPQLLRDRIQQSLRTASRERQHLAIIVIDLDRINDVESTLGQRCRDEFLQEAARRLRTCLRDSDVCGHLSSGQIAAALPNTSADGATACAAKINETLDSVVVVGGVAMQSLSRAGIAIYPAHGASQDVLFDRAHAAVTRAKSAHAGIAVYAPAGQSSPLQRLTLNTDLRNAIEAGSLELFFQPILCLKTMRIAAVEALLRWSHPQLGSISPDIFVGIAERSGLMRSLTEWVLQEAISTAARWREAGIHVNVAVNLSSINLNEADLPARIGRWLSAYELAPQYLSVELTETAAISDIAHAIEVLGRLAEMGVRIAIDDFGTGMSSLSYLKRLPMQDIKIDRCFVTEMMCDESNAILVRSITDLAHQLGRRVIAEGIEDKETLHALREIGCDAAQGNYVGRPVSEADIKPMLRAGIVGQESDRVTDNMLTTAQLRGVA